MLPKKKVFITTPIFYLNDRPHLGHAYTLVVTDIIVRYKKSRGCVVSVQTGSDEHGEKILNTAKKKELQPLELVEQNLFFFKELLIKINFSQNFFFRTSSTQHWKKTQKKFKKLLDQGDIYLGQYKGEYCVVCEEYVTDNLSQCLNCQKPLETLEEPAFFLRTTKYYSWLKDYYQQFDDFIIPKELKKSCLDNFLSENVRDLCLTRRNLPWGITLDGNLKLTIYVWFEALLNYINSSEGKKSFSNNETEIIQVIGKDIVRFHCVYWPIILHLLKLRLPSRIIVHGWILNQKSKMSKSKGNVIDPLVLLNHYPTDLLRAYLIAKIPLFEDGSFNENHLKEFYQVFFVNKLGNLVVRVNRMVWLYNDGVIPCAIPSYQEKDVFLNDYFFSLQRTANQFVKFMDEQQLTKAFHLLEFLVSNSNKLINDMTPWKRIHTDKLLVDTFLNQIINGIRVLNFFLSFFIPESSLKISRVFSFSKIITNWDNFLELNDIEGLDVERDVSLF